MSRQKKLMPISLDDVAFIFDNKMDDFHFSIAHCYCRRCDEGYNSTITNHTIVLNELHDLELKGTCLKCGYEMGHYIETGELDAFAKNAEAIWKTNKALKELKIKKTK